MKKTSILLTLAMVASMAVTVQATYIVSLADDFDTGISAATNDQNLNYLARQSGAGAPNAWDNLKFDDQNNASWDNRVSVTDQASGHQLKVSTGIGEQGLWNPGQTDLVQNSQYRVSFDVKGVNNWAFVRLNSTATGGSMELGLLVSATDWVQLWENSSTVFNPGATTPSGANGLHHIEITVTDGFADINVDNGAWSIIGRDWRGIGSGATGIGSFSVFSAAGASAYLDNFVYEVVPEPATLSLIGLVGGGMLYFRKKFMV